MILHPRQFRLQYLLVSIAAVALIFFSSRVSWAQVYIDPTAPPIGGRSATVLDASGVTQQKFGSLLIGRSDAAAARFCLNGTGDFTGLDDATNSTPGLHCIKSWTDVLYAIGGPFVNVNQAAAATYNDLVPAQSGYVHVQAALDTAATAYMANNLVGPTATALYAGTSSIDDNAGYFAGNFLVEPISIGTRGRLCLNSTCNVGAGGACQTEVQQGYYCISNWNQISIPSITDELTLQPTSLPATESGSVWLQQAFNAGAAVIGVPPSTSPPGLTKPYCGDGMCNVEIIEDNSVFANYCPLDCETIPKVPSLSASTVSTGVQITFTTTAVKSGNLKPSILIVRSIDPNFKFEPSDGFSYAKGGDKNLAIVHVDKTTTSFLDNGFGMQKNLTYYYRAYEANDYPRYLKVPYGQNNFTAATGVAGANTP